MNIPISDGVRHTSDASNWGTNYTPLIIFNEKNRDLHYFTDSGDFSH